MLLGDGSQLFARCSTKLHYIVRQAPFKQATLADEDVSVDFAAVTTPNDRVAVVATMPLTRDETWTPASRTRCGCSRAASSCGRYRPSAAATFCASGFCGSSACAAARSAFTRSRSPMNSYVMNARSA